MSWLPPPLIGSAIASALLIPILLTVLRHAPKALRRPGPRLQVSFAIVWIVWLCSGIALIVIDTRPPMADWFAGASVLIGAMLATHVAWSLLVWGFTVNLLTALVGASNRMDRDAWVNAYSGGRSDRQICLDRLGVLTGLGVAKESSGKYSLIPMSAYPILLGYRAARGLFGIRP